MTDLFADPSRLLWLLALPLLYLLSRPPRPQDRRLTAHMQQWLQARARLKRRPVRFRWLRFLLLLLAFLAVVLAHAGARVGGRPGASELVILVDTSASMAAQDPTGGLVWTKVRSRLAGKLPQLPDHVPVRMALCGAKQQLLRGDRQQLLASLPSQPTGRLAVDLGAVAERLQDERVAVWTITDGHGKGTDVRHGGLTVVGGSSDNVAITALQVRDAWPLRDVQLETTVQNLGRQPQTLRVAVSGGVEEVSQRTVELAPGTSEHLTLALTRTSGGPLQLSLSDHRDALELDNRVQILLPPPPAPDIAVYWPEGTAHPILEAAAQTLAEESGGRVLPRGQAETAGFLLVDGGAMPSLGAGVRALTFGTWVLAGDAQPRDRARSPVLVDWDRRDPITKGLDLSGLQIDRALRRGFAPPGQAIVRGSEGDLAVVFEGAESASVHLAFRLNDSNFPLLAAFPQFLRRSYVRAYGKKARPVVLPHNLLNPLESDLRSRPRQPPRPLPEFRQLPVSLTVPLLCLALLLLAIRVYV